jgi:3-hydroxyisobutyrate dehydrogenase-like beta-hydroxyacid dehydrogenase
MDRDIGFIGLGAMGLPMARNLLERGFRVRVYNRSEGRSRELVKLGAIASAVPADVVGPDGIVITMVSDDQALRVVTLGENGIGGRLGHGGLHISMSTVSPDLVRLLAEQHGRSGAALVSAPVSGRPDAAEAAALTVWLAGAGKDKVRARGVLAALASAIHDVGEHAPAANVAKLAANLMVLSSVEMLAEALELAERGGVDRKTLAAALTERLFTGPILSGYAARVAARSDTPAGFKLALALKDIDLVVRAAATTDATLPFAQVLRQRLKAAYIHGLGEHDVAALAADLQAPDAAGHPVASAGAGA